MSVRKGKGAGSNESAGAAKARTKGPTAQEFKQELPVVKKAKPKARPAQIERALRYLLEHIEDRTSADKDERGAWNETYSQFQDHAPGSTLARFEGLQQDKEWIHAGRPVDPALRWILQGKDFAFKSEDRVRPGESEAEERASRLDLKGAVDALSSLVKFPEPQDAYIVFLWCAQARVYDLLPACCHIAFSGPPSSGKTTALKSVLAIVNGEFISDASEAYVARILDEGRILGFDEVDEQLWAHKDGMLESILRQATDPKAKRRILEPIGEGEWSPRDLELYRPCAFTYTSEIERALTTRTLLMRLQPDADSARVVRNLFPDASLAALRIWLLDMSDEVRRSWTREKVQGYIRSEEFLERLDKLHGGLPRDRQTAAILLATAEMFSWREEVEDVVLTSLRAAAEDRTTEDESLVVQELAAGLWHAPSLPEGQEWVWQDELLTRVNDRLKAEGQRAWSSEKLGRRLARLGLQDGKDRIKVRTEHGRRRILRTETVERLLSPISPYLSPTGATGATGASRQASLDEAAAPVAPVAPVGGSIEEGEQAIIDRELYDSARRCMFERPGETEDWYVQDLMLAHQTPGKDRLAVEKTVHQAYLISLREKTHLPAASSEEISADQAEGPAGKEEQVKRRIRSLAVLAHLRSPEEPLEEIAVRIADELRKHGHVVDLEQVKAEARGVIARAAEDHSDEGGRPS